MSLYSTTVHNITTAWYDEEGGLDLGRAGWDVLEKFLEVFSRMEYYKIHMT